MKITRQGILDLNIKQTNGRWQEPHPVILNEEDMQARSLDLTLPGQRKALRRLEEHNDYVEEQLNLNS